MTQAKLETRDTPVAVITGGARRIGRQIAIELHEAGLDIALHYRSSSADAEDLAAKLLEDRPGSCVLFQADLNSLSEVQALGADLLARYPAIAILVNNASGFSPTPIDTATPAQFDAMVSSNLRGAYFLIQQLLPALKSGEGSIVNVLDMHLTRPLNGYSAYLAAKAGLASLTRSLAVELGPEIRVNGVAPGAILWPEDEIAYDEQARATTIARTPLKRLGTPADIASTVKFLAQEAPFITGQVITVDGGQSLT